MKSPEDWDYAALRRRAVELSKPYFCAGLAAAGSHCRHCPQDDAEHCTLTCRAAYQNLYGFEPP
jgi:hypothetical protein